MRRVTEVEESFIVEVRRSTSPVSETTTETGEGEKIHDEND